MKILLTGGGSGGHFYPIIAIAEAINKLRKENRLMNADIYYMSNSPYNAGTLFDNSITFKKNSAGKIRRYFSILNFFDLFKTFWGVLGSLWEVFNIYPDVVFSKGGYASFPALFAAKVFRIPVVIHESDSVPGRVNLWAGKFAEKIAVSYPEAAEYFPKEKVAYTGNPVRKELIQPLKTGAREFLKLEDNTPVLFILGGSLGSQIINETIVDALPRLVERFEVIHQVGRKNLKQVTERASVMLRDNPHENRYKPFDYLNVLGMRMAAGAANIVISRAGSTIFEIASWKIPSIIIPITDTNGDHQRKNAFAYARSGACVVVEEENLSANILVSEINRLMDSSTGREAMKKGTESFNHPDAAEKIAKEILTIALRHEK
ncbi:MAG: UDP-N-acetylglucosamine--N-acetylmuramyl-(pentapeptide) pyrophosphoryl-undecaprenol N-acetylglucosamine transferase [Parcubacteria group bacterium]|nr:UDP-N-acetylglucosamine--N-acetylmuramyl-(pentapeptide) pyrophosphoryl-undecaprenol N-acetylglucosamine transferase [Parcubacteria group bacterium]